MSDRPVAHWLYPVNAKTDSRINTLDGLEPATLGAFRRIDYDVHSFWGLSSGFRSMREGDLLWVYFARPDSVVAALGHVLNVQLDGSGVGHEVVLAWAEAATIALLAAPIPLASLGRPPRAIRRAEAATSGLLRAWLVDHRFTLIS